MCNLYSESYPLLLSSMPLKFVGLQMNNLVCREEVSNGRSDDVIPPEHSIRFAKEAGCTLHVIDGDHRLKGSLVIG